MKKVILAFAVILMAISAQSQDPISNFILKHGHKRANEKVVIRLSRLPLSLAVPFIDKEARRWIRKTNFVEIMALEGTHSALTDDFTKLGRTLQRRNYEPLMTVKNDGDHVSILAKTDNRDNIREVVLLVNDSGKDAVLIRVKGKFSLSDINKIQHEVARNNFGR